MLVNTRAYVDYKEFYFSIFAWKVLFSVFTCKICNCKKFPLWFLLLDRTRCQLQSRIFENTLRKGSSIKDVSNVEGGRGMWIADMGRCDGGRGQKNPISTPIHNLQFGFFFNINSNGLKRILWVSPDFAALWNSNFFLSILQLTDCCPI
jgi:hypothetical protein